MAKSSKRNSGRSHANAKLTANLQVAVKTPEQKLREQEKRPYEKARRHARLAAARQAGFQAGLKDARKGKSDG